MVGGSGTKYEVMICLLLELEEVGLGVVVVLLRVEDEVVAGRLLVVVVEELVRELA